MQQYSLALTMVQSGRLVAGCLLWLLLRDGNLMGSRTKNTGLSNVRTGSVRFDGETLTMWFPTISWLPCSVKNLTEKPRTSRTVSALPFSPPVVLRRNRTGVFLPTPLRNLAEVREEMSLVTSNSPQAPAALAWTTLFHFSTLCLLQKSGRRIPDLSGIRSRLKCASVSRRSVSPSVVRPPPPKVGSVVLMDGSAIGWPYLVLERPCNVTIFGVIPSANVKVLFGIVKCLFKMLNGYDTSSPFSEKQENPWLLSVCFPTVNQEFGTILHQRDSKSGPR